MYVNWTQVDLAQIDCRDYLNEFLGGFPKRFKVCHDLYCLCVLQIPYTVKQEYVFLKLLTSKF